jgi:centromere/kinetochore protein ZW10
MENAVRFELDSSRIRIKYQLSVGETAGIALSTVLEAMEVWIYDLTSVSIFIFISVLSHLLDYTFWHLTVLDLSR